MKLDLKKLLDYWIGGTLLVLFRPIVILLGKILKRNHSPDVRGDIAFIKLLGGGSLVIALPALLALKKQFPKSRLYLVTTPGIKAFAETLGIFDEYVVINDRSVLSLATSGIKGLRTLWQIDTVIDYEVHSRLTTLFALFTCARNRIGFYREDVKDRQYFATHTIFFNLFYGSWYFYEKISKLLGASIPTDEEVRQHFLRANTIKRETSGPIKIGIGHGCSDLSPERMLAKEHWLMHFERNLPPGDCEVHFLGGPKEKEYGDEIIAFVKNKLPKVTFINDCGKMKLRESVKLLAHMNEFWGIDSALLHYSRLMGVKTTAFFGPTMPQSLIKPFPYLDEKILYAQIPCSPCVHVTETPPCQGDNQCIKKLFNL